MTLGQNNVSMNEERRKRIALSHTFKLALAVCHIKFTWLSDYKPNLPNSFISRRSHFFIISLFHPFTFSPFHLYTFIRLFTLPNGVSITNFPLPFPLILRRFYLHLSVFVYFKQAFCPYIKIIAYFCRCCAMRNKTKRDA